MEKTVAALENEVKNLERRMTAVEAKADESQKLLRWGMGAAAAFGALVPILLPRVGAALGMGG